VTFDEMEAARRQRLEALPPRLAPNSPTYSALDLERVAEDRRVLGTSGDADPLRVADRPGGGQGRKGGGLGDAQRDGAEVAQARSRGVAAPLLTGEPPLRIIRGPIYGRGEVVETVKSLLDANERFAEGFDKGDLQLPPNRPVAVLTCIDARLHPAEFLGFEIGDAHVLRNAGGRATDDALRSLIISSQLLGTREFLVIHHTDCGMLTFTNQDIWNKLQAETGASAEEIDFLPFTDVEESLREDVKTIRENPFLPKDVEVTGWVYDVSTGKLREIPA
jgi:carbonic anhydrase